ncbi:hypothetical protein P3T76_003235 [Phytophthora citrophthora]|uniref:Uncharacterized protein n=1 Tax=Phytophthora citrophthora TaxID=4793 RepID=A0AAD9GTY0_9STRA|nr:hypothetical protein P3T76_003235 [Phytophthora citrophthora]
MPTIPSLRRLITFTDEDEKTKCSTISVKGDATYCIDGPVCGKPSQGACPSKGDAAIGHCVQTSRSFATGCVAPVDAQCVISALGHWECLFQDANNDSTSSTVLDDKTPTPTPVATLSGSKMALSASTKDSHTDSDVEVVVAKTPNAALNVVVGAACCILAFVGIMLAKKRRKAKQARGSVLSHNNSSIMTL